jgi:Zn-dependent peptidase ImmA (M78 family)
MMTRDGDQASREYQPDFDADERERRAGPQRTIARRLAGALLSENKIISPQVDVEALARKCGLEVAYVDVDGKLSGQLYPDIPEIVINRRGRGRERQRFTIAHELGHWRLRHHLLGALPEDTLGYSGAFEDEGSHEGRSPVEIEANTFAAELLMPSSWIRKLQKPLKTGAPQQLARQYGVSEQAMFYQLMHCRLI